MRAAALPAAHMLATRPHPARTRQPSKSLRVVLWTAQIALALLFVYAGVMKFVMPPAVLTAQSPFSVAFLHFIGVMETLGGLGLVLPAVTAIRPKLVPLAATGLVVIMIGATVTTLATGLGAVAAFPAVVGLVAAFVAVGRARLAPHAARA